MVTVVPRVFKSPITSFEANCACRTWIPPTVEMMKVLTITKEFIQEVKAFSPFMRDYSTTGFYLAKFDEIGYQVCPSSSIVKYEQSQKYWVFFGKSALFTFSHPVKTLHEWEEFVQDSWQRLKQSGWNGQPSYEQLLRASYPEKNTWDMEVNYVGEVEFVSLW